MVEGRSELQLLEEAWRKAKRREILERLNSYQADISEDDRRREETLRRELKIEIEKHRRPHPGL